MNGLLPIIRRARRPLYPPEDAAPAALPAALVAPVLPAVPVVPAVPVEVDAPESAPVRSKVKKAKGEHDREDVSTHPA